MLDPRILKEMLDADYERVSELARDLGFEMEKFDNPESFLLRFLSDDQKVNYGEMLETAIFSMLLFYLSGKKDIFNRSLTLQVKNSCTIIMAICDHTLKRLDEQRQSEEN